MQNSRHDFPALPARLLQTVCPVSGHLRAPPNPPNSPSTITWVLILPDLLAPLLLSTTLCHELSSNQPLAGSALVQPFAFGFRLWASFCTLRSAFHIFQRRPHFWC